MGKSVTLSVLVVAFFLLSIPALAADSISVSKINGYDTTNGGLMTNMPIKFYINYEVGLKRVTAVGNPFEIFSTDGAIWQPISAQALVPLSSWFSGGGPFLEFGIDGQGADTIDLWLFDAQFPAVGFEPGYNDEIFLIKTFLTDDQIGKTLCIDTANRYGFYWGFEDGSGTSPKWEGLQCFEIVDCCSGHRGDVNGDGTGPNILDLNWIVNYIFRGSSLPPCALESDLNSDGIPSNILDLNFIVNYIHRGGPLPGPCPAD